MRRSPRETATLETPEGERWTMRKERHPNASYGRPFLTVFPDALLPLAMDAKAPKGALPVLVWCWKNLSHSEWRQFNQIDVAFSLNTTGSSVNRSLKVLQDRGMVERRGAGPRLAWRLTPETCWRGYAGQYQQERRERAKAFTVIDGGRDDAEG